MSGGYFEPETAAYLEIITPISDVFVNFDIIEK